LLVALDGLNVEELRGIVIAVWLDQLGLDAPEDEDARAAPSCGRR
jgi:hypothetical protein